MNIVFYYPEMFIPFIKNSRIKIPQDPSKYNFTKYPHFSLFMALHLCVPVDVDYLENNANIISCFPLDRMKATVQDLLNYLDSTDFYLPPVNSPLV